MWSLAATRSRLPKVNYLVAPATITVEFNCLKREVEVMEDRKQAMKLMGGSGQVHFIHAFLGPPVTGLSQELRANAKVAMPRINEKVGELQPVRPLRGADRKPNDMTGAHRRNGALGLPAGNVIEPTVKPLMTAGVVSWQIY
jgi:hypothetical protein